MTVPAGPQALPAWTPTPAKIIARRWQVDVLVLREYPEQGTIGACNGTLIADEHELYAGPSERCTAAPSFTLAWPTITSFCYAYEETIPTHQLGRRWHGTLRIMAGGKEYLIGLGDRSQFDALRSFFHEYRGNIPEHCAHGPGAERSSANGSTSNSQENSTSTPATIACTSLKRTAARRWAKRSASLNIMNDPWRERLTREDLARTDSRLCRG